MRDVQQPAEYYRYCPGEEQIKISDAICIGRRRTNFPKCKGCQFNDDEKAAQQEAERMAEQRAQPTPESLIQKVFKAYDVRAVYPEPLSEEVAWRIGHGTATFLRTLLRGYERSDPKATSLAVGRDMRKSGQALKRAFIEGVLSTGTGVFDIGMIDTPQLYFAVNHLGTCGGAQTTASHNPEQYNGFKICGKAGKPVGEDTGLGEIRRIALQVAPHEAITHVGITPVDLAEPYKQFVLKDLRKPRKLKVVVDASNGMAGRWFPIIFGDLDLDLTAVNFRHDGTFVHDPNPLVEANLEQLKAEVLGRGADFGICFDGDADRLMMVDERAQTVRCDYLTALLARGFLEHNPGATIVYDLRSSRVVAEEIRAAGGVPRRERVGHAFIKRTMAETNAAFGGELSGHFYFRDNWFCDSGMLACVHMLNLLSGSDRPFSELVKPLRRYANSGEINFQVADKDAMIAELEKKYADAEIDHLDGVTITYPDWWVNVRKSNTEPLLRLNLEADSADRLHAKLEELQRLLGRPVDH